MKDQQILGLDAQVELGVQIEFPEHYTEADMDAVWNAVREIQRERNLIPRRD